MTAPTPDVRAIFDRAAELDAPADREAYLDAACAGSPDARREVDALLRAAGAAGNFLARPAVPPAVLPSTDPNRPGPEAAGAVLAGRYKLLQPIGEGGMGSVWMAQQTEPVRRLVALKVLKAGMDSRQVLARFEAERQALALMDHPHIARVLDAGTTDGGRPFFVMELVKGVPITQFCDDRQLRVADRLALFQQVCQAVHHAHQKGVIHRDLKPSNVLVESHDGTPVPKVIDFGLAKALTALPLTDKSLFTLFGSVVGTPLYMAPEQAEFGALDVDTRADIYSLGVLLYELLTGTTPLEKGRLAAAAWDEIRRVIKEEEPQTPSARLSTSAGRAGVAARRQTEPAKLGRFVRGDLDWVVMKALAKERDRRYESATAFAADVGRFLRDEPVAAGPPTIRYKVRKFVRRNRGPVLAAAGVGLALVAGVAGTTWGLVRAADARLEAGLVRERQEAEERAHAEAIRQERVRAALDKAFLEAMGADFAAAEASVNLAEREGASAGQVHMLRGQIAYYQGDTARAVEELKKAADLLPNSVAVRGLHAATFLASASLAEQHQVFDELRRLTAVTPEDHLFKGLGLSMVDAESGLPELDEAIRRRASVVAFLARADARASYLQQVSPDPLLAAGAMADASAARALLPGNAAVLRTSLRAHLVAHLVYRDAGRAQEADVALRQARIDYLALTPFQSQPDTANLRYYFVRETDAADAALAEARRCHAAGPDPLVAANYAQQLYRHGRFADAEKVMTDTKAAFAMDWVRLLAVAELRPDGRERAYELYQEMARKPLSAWEAFNGLLALGAIGRWDAARAEARKLLAQPNESLPLRPRPFRRLVEFIAEGGDEGLFLADRAFNRADLCNAHLAVGLRRLARGDRDGACDQFHKAIDTRVIDFIPYDISSLLLARMEQDAVWPAWAVVPAH